MRIALVIESLDASRGGAEQWTSQYARWLAETGHEVHVVARHFGDDVSAGARQLAEMASPARVVFRSAKERPFAERKATMDGSPATAGCVIAHRIERAKSRVDFAIAAQQTLEALAADVIHDMGSGWHCDLFQPHGGSRTAAFEQNLLLLPRWLRPIKRTASRYLPRQREFQRLLRGQYRAEDRIFIALSRMVARDFERFHGVRRSQIRLIYNGVDTERFSPDHRPRYRRQVRDELGVGAHETLLLIVAHNFRLKGVPALLAAVERLRGEGLPVKLVVVGGKRQPRGLHPAVMFVGPAVDTVPYYAAADVYVQPTFYDPCSLVVLEAWASGLPVITSRYNGASELMSPGVEGAVLDDPANIDALGTALRRLLDPAVREPMSIAARKLALRHTLERNAREIVAVYEEVLARRRRAAA